MSKESMLASTIIITIITLLFLYISYMQNDLFNFTMIIMCASNLVLIIYVVSVYLENTKIEKWIYKKWDQLDLETQQGIRGCVLLLVILAMVITAIISLNSIHMRS